MPDFRWTIDLLNEIRAEVEITDVSDRTVLKLGITVIIAVVIIAVIAAAVIILR